jgi:hypothetical protein
MSFLVKLFLPNEPIWALIIPPPPSFFYNFGFILVEIFKFKSISGVLRMQDYWQAMCTAWPGFP